MMMNTMTRTSKKKARRSSVVDAKGSSTQCCPRHGVIPSPDGVPERLRQQLEHCKGRQRLGAPRKTPYTHQDGLNYIIDRRFI